MALLLNKEATKSASVDIIYSDKEKVVTLFNKDYALAKEREMIFEGNFDLIDFNDPEIDPITIIDASMKDKDAVGGLTSEQFILTLSVER